MANFAKVHEKTQILNEDWKKLRVQPVQLMKPVSGHPFLKQVCRGKGAASASGDWNQDSAGRCGDMDEFLSVLSVPHSSAMQKWIKSTPKAFSCDGVHRVHVGLLCLS